MSSTAADVLGNRRGGWTELAETLCKGFFVVAFLSALGLLLWTLHEQRDEERQDKGAFTPDPTARLGRIAGHLLLQGEGGQVYMTRVDGSGREDLFTGSIQPPLALSADGSRLAYVDAEGLIGIINLVTLDAEAVREAPAARFVRMSWSPDGSQLAYACGLVDPDVDRDLHTVNMETNETFVVASPGTSTSERYNYRGAAVCTIHAIHWSGDGLFYIMTTTFPEFISGLGPGPIHDDCGNPVIFTRTMEPSGQPRGSPERVFRDVPFGSRETKDGFSWSKYVRREEGGPERTQKEKAMCTYDVGGREASCLTVGNESFLDAEPSPTDPRTFWYSHHGAKGSLSTAGLCVVDDDGERVVDEYFKADGFKALWSRDGRHLLVERRIKETAEDDFLYRIEYYVVGLEALGDRLRLDLPSGARVLDWIPDIPSAGANPPMSTPATTAMSR